MSYDWKNILVNPEMLLREVLMLMDGESLRVALVADEEHALLGIATDGDIRRGLLNNFDLDTPVKFFMNKHPVIAPLGTPRSELVKKMESAEILCVPLLSGPTIVGLETYQIHQTVHRKDNPVFIMAGGFGTRLRPLTDNCPKPMLHLDGKPILEIVLLQFIKAGFHNFYISTHYLANVIHEYFGDGSGWNVDIFYIHEESPLGTGGALGLLPDDISDLPLIFLNGDVLTTLDFEKVLEFHTKSDAVATMCVRGYEYRVPYGVIKSDGNKIVSMIEKPTQRFFVNAGIYVINPDIINSVEKNRAVDMPDLLERQIKKGHNVLTFPIHEYWLDIGRMDDYRRAQVDILDLDL